MPSPSTFTLSLLGVSLVVVVCSKAVNHYLSSTGSSSSSVIRMAEQPQRKPVTKFSKPDPRFANLESVKGLSSNAVEFSLASYKQLAEVAGPQGNVFYSPASVSTALAMVYLGARGTTAQEMGDALHLSALGSEVHETIRDFYDTLQSADADYAGYVLKAANRLFCAQDYKFLDSFNAECLKYYHAESSSCDFKGDTEGCRQTINKWVESQTAEKIKELIPDGMINDLTKMILVNAIYFKGSWLYPFDRSTTSTQQFYVGGSDQGVPVEMMSITTKDLKADDCQKYDCKIVELPYGNKELNMYIVLPNKRDGLAALEQQLDGETFKALTAKLHIRYEVTLKLPRFRVEYQSNLNKMLQSLGMTSVFTEGADLSGMDGTRNLSVSQVVHKAYVEVNEEGTEAAASTALGIAITSMSPPLLVNCEHPFMFYIQERASGNIIFMGRLAKPEA